MTSKLILLNGPIGCGKTDATKEIKSFLPDAVDRRCKDRLHQMTMDFFDIPETSYWQWYEDREEKERPRKEFTISVEMALELRKHINFQPFMAAWGVHLSLRQAMIFISEVVAKPTFGEDYFGVYRANSIQDGEISIDDSVGGWKEEITPVIERLGAENILLIRIYGRGDYEGDSRKYLEDGILLAENTKEVYNVGTLDQFLDTVNFIVADFLKEEE